jgi:DNA-binding Xre family transcriptional regulator
MDNDNKLVKIEWRLMQMMAERRIKKNTEMAHRLREVGVDISTHQVGRLVEEFPERLNTNYLRGFLTVLQCNIEDLIRVHAADVENVIEGKNSVHVVPEAPQRKAPIRAAKRIVGTKTAATESPQSRALPEGVDDYTGNK